MFLRELCEVCHDSIEDERLVRNPLITTCLDHLTSDERRALEQDLDLASRVQGELLPRRDLRLGGREFSYHYEPAGLVSGDYCDLVKANTEKDGDLFFLLGNVSGKGVAASMLMAHLHAIFRSLIAGGLPVDKLVERANHIFCESTLPSHFATLVCGRAGRSAELEFCIAGHCPPMLVRNGKVTSLKATRLPIGMFCDAKYTVERLELAAQDSLLMYTDGLTEARNGTGVEYGVERLLKLVSDTTLLTPRSLIDACLKDMRAFRSEAPKTDDLTIMVI